MDRDEAARVLEQQLDHLADAGYTALAGRIGELLVEERRGPSGAAYQLELHIAWDHRPGGAIRVLGGIDDGGWSALLPLSDSRLVEPPQETAHG
jgi:hypothetical protein